MKLKTAAKIEYTFDIIMGVLYLPFKLISVIIYYILQPFVWLENKRDVYSTYHKSFVGKRKRHLTNINMENLVH